MFEKQILSGYYTSQQICVCRWGPPSYTFFLSERLLSWSTSFYNSKCSSKQFLWPPFLPSRYHGQVGFTGFHQQTNEQISICTVYLISTRTTIFAWNVLTFVIMTIRKLQIYLAYAFLQNRVQHKTFHTNNHMFFITLCTSLQMFCFGTPFEFAQHFEATRPAKCATQYEQQSQRAIHENCKPMATRRIFFESNLLKHVHHRRSKTWHVVVVVSRSAHNGMHMQ